MLKKYLKKLQLKRKYQIYIKVYSGYLLSLDKDPFNKLLLEGKDLWIVHFPELVSFESWVKGSKYHIWIEKEDEDTGKIIWVKVSVKNPNLDKMITQLETNRQKYLDWKNGK